MTDITRRAEIGPSITFQTRENQMARIAQQDTYMEDADGIRRLVVAGSPVPTGFDVEGAEEVPTRSLSEVVVDEEASKSHAERTGTEQRKAGSGLRNVVTELGSGGSGGGEGGGKAARKAKD